jgi:hypothetical protein
MEQVFYGEHGVAVVPGGGGTTPLRAFGNAVDRLIAMTAGDERRDPRDVHFGRTVVRILAAAEVARRERRAVAV